MPSQQYFVEGFDPTVDPSACVSRAELLQLIRAAKTNVSLKTGLAIQADSAPDVVTYPELAYFIWLKSVAGVPNGEFYYYNGTSWTLLSIVDGSLLANNSIPLTKISRSGAAALQLIQVNAAGTALVWASINDVIVNNTLPIAKLVGGGAGNKILTSLAGTNTWSTPDAVAALFSNNIIALAKVVNGGAGDFLFTSRSSTNQFITFDALMGFLTDGIITLAKLSGTGGTAGQAIRRNTSNNGWEFFTPITTAMVAVDLGTQTVPAAYGVRTFNHSLGRIPYMITPYLICTTLDGDYSVGDYYSLYRAYNDAGNGNEYLSGVVATTTNVQISFPAAHATYIFNKSTDSAFAITRANWSCKVIVS